MLFSNSILHSFPLLFVYFTILFFFTVLPVSTQASPVYDAGLLMHPVSRKSLIDALIALPDVTWLFKGLSPLVPTPPIPKSSSYFIRVDVRTNSDNDVLPELSVSSNGNYLIIDKHTRAALPVRADPDTTPTIVRRNNGNKVTIVVRTLVSRISACNGDRKCLNTILTAVCPPRIYNTRYESVQAALEKCTNSNTNDINWNGNGDKKKLHLASFSKFATVFYRLLFTILTLAQLGVLVWGAAFSISYIAGEISDITLKLSRRLFQSCTLLQYLLSFLFLFQTQEQPTQYYQRR